MAGLPSLPFATVLKRYRLAAGLTQQELAERARLSARAVSALERGVNRRPHKDTLRLLADALELSGEERSRFEAAARGAAVPPGHAWKEVAPAGAPSTPLVGRARELELIEQHLRGLGPPALLLAGEPGIGKTRLLREAARRGYLGDMTVLWGGCQRRSGAQPYSPLVEALARHVAQQPRAGLRAALQDCAWLVRLLPELEEIARPSVAKVAREQERRLVFRAVGKYLGNVAGPGGTLLVLDDLQWAGSDALDLLLAVAQSADALPVRVVGAYRQTGVTAEAPLAAAVGEMAHHDLAQRLLLGPLAQEEAAELLAHLLKGERIGPAIREQLLERAEGMPFFLVSLAQAFRAGTLTETGGGLPWSIAESIRHQVAALPAAGQEVLDVAAVAGRVVSRPVLMAVVARPEQEVVAALEAVCRAGFLLEKGTQAYRFAHDVIREVSEADLGAARRGVLHRKIAEAVEQLPGREKRAAELAWHYYQGDDPAKALPYALLAGDQAEAVCAHAEAEHHYRMAVSLARELGPSASAGTRLEAVALEKLGQVLDAAARYDEALDVLGQAAELHRTAGRLDRLGRVGTQIGRAHAGQGTPGEGLARVQALVPLLEGQNVLAGLAALYATLAHLHFMERDFAEQLVAAEQALDLARAAHEDRLLAEAEVWRGMALVLLGRRNEGHLALERALSMAEQVGDLEVLRRALNHVTDMYLLAGQLGASLAYGQRAREVAEQLADPPAVAVALSLLGQSLLQLGKWEEAGEHFRQAMDLAGSASASWDSAWPPAGLGALHMFQGNAEEATHLLEEASVMAERTGDLQMLRIAQIYLAERDLLAGCPQAARNRLERLLDLPGEGRVDVDIVLAQALLDLGNEVGAEALARRAAESAGPRRVIRVEALRVLGLALSRQDRGAEADRALCEALSIARSMLFVFGEARVLHACGMHHMHQSRTKDARKHLEEALAVFRQLGARPYAARTERALAQIASPSERGGNGREGPE